MAQCKLSPQEFIKNAFTPQIAVLCSTSVDEICRKNNLTFVELVQPFCKLGSDVNLQDGNGGVVPIRNLKITLMDINFRPPQPTLARKLLSTVISQVSESRSQMLQIGEGNLNIPSSTPWFEVWREMFLHVQYPSDHEFTKHYLASMLVTSSADANPLETLNYIDQVLSQQQNVAPNKLPKWFNSQTLRYYVLVHDNTDGDNNRTQQLMEALNLAYGIGKVFLLRINSRSPGQMEEQLPDPWSQYITNAFDSTDNAHLTPDDSPNASKQSARSPDVGVEPGDAGNNLPYHPLSPDTETSTLSDVLEKEMLLESPTTNAVHGMCLTTNDVEQVKLLIYEFCTRALLPYVERQIQNLTETVSNKKGVSKSLFSATKRWFTPNKAGLNNGSVNMPIYALDALELQMRKLGDLYFMFGHYSMAFQVYHTAKRDFNADQAWFYYAGALEMAGLAAFMANECSRKTCDYIEESITTYLNVCKMAQFATRATLLSSECLKSRNLHGEAAHQLIRMTSEESDLRSALLLEQAAYCFLNCSRSPMLRKYAFHMVLAGHRFSKASQKKHALRCYKQALEVYQNKAWTFAEDHVHYTIGKLSSGLNVLEEAAKSFSKLLTVQSKQSVEQQTLFLKEYLSTMRMLRQSGYCQDIPILLLPVLKSEATKILVGPTPPLSIPGKVRAEGITFTTSDDAKAKLKWLKLEEMIVHEAQGSMPYFFKSAVTLFTKDNFGNTKITAVANEPIQVSLKLHNPLSVQLTVKNMFLLWNFVDEKGNITSNEQNRSSLDDYLSTNVVKSVVLQSNSSREVNLLITPLIVGKLILRGMFYKLLDLEGTENATFVEGKQLFDFKRLSYVRDEGAEVNSDRHERLLISVMPPAPCLQVTFEDINVEMLCNEIKSVSMEMRNVGSGPLHKVFLATSTPHLLSSCEFRDKDLAFGEVSDLDVPAVRDKFARKNHVMQVPLPNDYLEPGQSYSVNIWLKAPSMKGNQLVDLLIYYENCSNTSIPRYRLIRHVWNLKVQDSMKVQLKVVESCKSEAVKEVLLQIKATNMNKSYLNAWSKMPLIKVGMLSSWWKLKLSEYIQDCHSLAVNSEQSAYLLLRAQRNITKYSKYCEIPLTNEQTDSYSSACVDFAKGFGQIRVNAFEDYSTIKNDGVQGGWLFINWKAHIVDNFKNERIGYGQTVIEVDKNMTEDEEIQEEEGQVLLYDSNQSLEIQTPVKENKLTDELCTQISVGITHNTCIIHDFKTNKICIVPVRISVHNDALVTSTVIINTTGTNSTSVLKPNLLCPYPSKDYRWIGFSGMTRTLAPLSSETVTQYVAVSSPGVYDLGGRLELWCQNKLHNEPILQSIQALGFLSVNGSN